MLKSYFLQCYTTLLDDARVDANVLGVILAGSRARSMQNDQSDCDIYIIFKDTVTQEQIKNYHKTYNDKYRGKLKLDISNKALQTLSEFTYYAELGTPYYYDRYNLVHGKIEVDKTNGEIEKLVQEIETLTKEEQATIIHNNLGDYISLVYQSVKSYEAGRKIAASLDAAESTEYLLTSLFAFTHRVRPYVINTWNGNLSTIL
jgi:predicted nucleotidyltransferase